MAMLNNQRVTIVEEVVNFQALITDAPVPMDPWFQRIPAGLCFTFRPVWGVLAHPRMFFGRFSGWEWNISGCLMLPPLIFWWDSKRQYVVNFRENRVPQHPWISFDHVPCFKNATICLDKTIWEIKVVSPILGLLVYYGLASCVSWSNMVETAYNHHPK